MTSYPYPRAMEDFPTLRQSTLAAFDACPLSWRFEQLYAKNFSIAAAARGILFHRWAAKMMRELAAQEEERIEVDVALAILHETLRQADVPADQVVPCPMYEISDLYWMVKKVAHEMTWNIKNLIDVEHPLRTTLAYPNPEGGVVERIFTGTLDVLFAEGEFLEHAIVVDYKSGWWLPPASEISESGYFQQRSYGLQVFDTHPSVASVTLREFYPRYCQSREATLYREQADDLRLEMSALAERFDAAYEAQAWQPMPGHQCSYCVNVTGCPIFPKARKVGSVQSREEAVALADQRLVMKAYFKQAEEALKGWSAVNGPIPVRHNKAEAVMGFRQSKRVERPTQEETRLAQQQGVDVLSLYKERIGTRFDVHIPGPRESEDDDKLIKQLEASLQQVEARQQDG